MDVVFLFLSFTSFFPKTRYRAYLQSVGGSAGEDANVGDIYGTGKECVSYTYKIFLRNGDTKILLHLNVPFIAASQDKEVWGYRMETGGRGGLNPS